MSPLLAVARRELVGLFKTPTALLFLVVFSALTSLVVLGQADLFARGQADLAPLFKALPWLSLLLLPALSMGVFSEERRAGSIELLLTLPLSLAQVTCGKFLAALALAGLALLSTTPLWAAIAYLGAPDHGAILAAYVGALLLAGALLSIGTFVSALTQSPASAFVGSITVGFVFLFSDVPAIRAVLPEALTDGFARLSFAAHYEAMARGVLGAGDVLFFVGTTATFLFATGLVLRARRRARRAPLVPLFAAYLVLAPTLLPLFAGWRADFTEGGLYSLSAGTRALLEDLEAEGGPLEFTLYVGRDAVAESPRFAGFVAFVEQELRDLERAADGKLDVRIVDAAPLTPADDEARAAGLSRIPLGTAGAGKELVFGLVAENAAGDRRTLGFISPESEGALEHELVRMAYELDNPERKKVGVVTSFTDENAPGHPLTGGLAGRGWQVVENTRAQFDYRGLELPLERVPDDLDVVWVLHPKGFDDATVQALAAYARAGGSLLVQLDPLSEIDTTGIDPEDYTSGFVAERESFLPGLLEPWGVKMSTRRVVADRTLGRKLPAGTVGNTEALTMPHWLTITPEHYPRTALAQSLLSGLQGLRLSSVGALEVAPADGLEARTLLTTSGDAMLLDVSQVQVVREPEGLMRDFVARGEPFVLGVDLVGMAPSTGAGPEATAPMRAIVLSDVDLTTDPLWVSVSDQPGNAYQAIASNGPFFARVLAELAGGADLGLASSPRESARYLRPFTRLDALEKAAEERLARELSEARALEAELSAALLAAAEEFDGRDDTLARGEIDRITAELKLARQELVALERDRRAAVEALELRLTRMSALAFPLLYLLLGLLLRLRR